jgi:exodeoxyribonuclease V alpha subunit
MTNTKAKNHAAAPKDNIAKTPVLTGHILRTISEIWGQTDETTDILFFLLEAEIQRGGTCLHLDLLAEQAIPDILADYGLAPNALTTLPRWSDEQKLPDKLPGKRQIINSLQKLTSDNNSPLILEENARLYYRRYHHLEQSVAKILRQKAHSRESMPLAARTRQVDKLLGQIFPKDSDPHQRLAALSPLIQDLTVVTGGPGTGKTTTLSKMLALIIMAFDLSERDIRIAAPTGKAAYRIQEAIRQTLEQMQAPPELRERIPRQAITLHRLLGYNPVRESFRYHSRHHLPYKVVVVDEASMISLSLMGQLTQALAPASKLILLGDPHQLYSIESGTVLRDIYFFSPTYSFSKGFQERISELSPHYGAGATESNEHGPKEHPFRNAIIRLQRNYRVDPEAQEIQKLSQAVQQEQTEDALKLIVNNELKNVRFYNLEMPRGNENASSEKLNPIAKQEDIIQKLSRFLTQEYKPIFGLQDPEELLHNLSRVTTLCAFQRLPLGVKHINRLLEQGLKDQGLIAPTDQPDYHKRPILITRNSYSQNLFNGDIGILAEEGKDRSNALFPGEGAIRRLAYHRLPEHETVYSLTIHKSQGSEYDHVILVLPASDHLKFYVNREHFYTAITRARKRITIWSSEAALRSVLETPVKRNSALADKIWA